MNALHYLRAYLDIFLRYGDHAAAKKAGDIAVLFAKKKRERRAAMRGRC